MKIHVLEALDGRPETFEADDLLGFLMSRWPTWPERARIYHGALAASHDVTPRDPVAAEMLKQLPGPFWVVRNAGGPTPFLTAVYVGMMLASVAVSYFLRPTLPKTKTAAAESPNNQLSARQNRERINGRVPDIFGRLRAVPDLLAVPYTEFDGHEEVEHSLLCIGRGAYEVEDIRDGSTPIDSIRGAAAEVYGPHSVVPGVPEVRIGNPIVAAGNKPLPLQIPTRISSISGQDLPPQKLASAAEGVYFAAPNEIHRAAGSQTDFSALFDVAGELTLTNANLQVPANGTFRARFVSNRIGYGAIEFATGQSLPSALSADDPITISANYPGTYKVHSVDGQYALLEDEDGSPVEWNAEKLVVSNWMDFQIAYPGSGSTVSLAGVFPLLSVTPDRIVLDNPRAVNSAWSVLPQFGDLSPLTSATMEQNGARWIGPFTVDFRGFSSLAVNFVAPNGLYSVDNHGTQYAISVNVKVETRQILDDEGTLGAPEVTDANLWGSATTRRLRGITVKPTVTWAVGDHPGKCQVRVARGTNFYAMDGVQFSQDVQVRDLFAFCEFPANQELGDVTVVRAVQRASAGVFAVKDRKLNCLVTRKLPKRVGDGFSTELYPTRSAADILCAMALDKRIGRRTLDELDVPGIYDAVAQVVAHFGKDVCGEFAHTFDDFSISFEEAFSAVAGAAFCVPYRQGAKLKIRPELPTETSTILFNHRNKVPGSESRSVRWGNESDNDGIELEYTSPVDDSKVTLYFPEDQSALNPKRIESVGVRSRVQAYYHAARALNRLKYGNVSTEFTATSEAELVLPQDRILVADNTRPDVQDGEVLSTNGLTIELSQPVTLTDSAESTSALGFALGFAFGGN